MNDAGTRPREGGLFGRSLEQAGLLLMPDLFQKLFRILNPIQLRSAAVLFFLMLIGMVLETLGVGLVVPILALIADPNVAANYPSLAFVFSTIGQDEPVLLIGSGIALLVIVYAVKVGFLAFLAWRQADFVFRLDAGLSTSLFRGYLLQPYTFHMQRNSATLIRNVTVEISQFTTAISAASLLVAESLVLIGIAALLLFAEPVGAGIVVVTLGLAGFLLYRVTRARVLRWGQTRQFHEGQRLQWLQQGLGGIKDIKVLGREQAFADNYAHHMTIGSAVGRQLNVLQAMPRLWLEFMAVLGLAALVLSMLVQNKPMDSLLPTLGLFAAAAFRLMPSVNRFLGGVQTLRYNLPVIDHLYAERLFLTQEPVDDCQPAVRFASALQLDAVTFSYPEAPGPVVDNVSVRIAKGSIVGFIGESGAGKSTLVDLVLGLLTPDAGKVTVDGADIQQSIRGWQSLIGYVPQTIFLTDESIRHNVALGLVDTEIDNAAVCNALHAAQLLEFVSGLPNGVDTIVGERGVRLSGGQRQRIGIARALYQNPSLLVLDEASSALDSETEREVMRSVLALRGKTTILIVAHRLSTVEHCDHIYRFDRGRVVADGKPQDILGGASGSIVSVAR